MTDVKKEPTAPLPAPQPKDGPPPKSEAKGARAPAPGARVCAGGDRAEPGLKRFRVRALGAAPNGTLKKVGTYLLAPDRATAEAHYLDVEKAALEAAGYLTPGTDAAGKRTEPLVPLLDVLELAD
jgi:hypothetical protein